MLDKGFRDTFREINLDELERGEGTYAVIFGQSQTSRVDFIYSKGNGIKTVEGIKSFSNRRFISTKANILSSAAHL